MYTKLKGRKAIYTINQGAALFNIKDFSEAL